MTALDRLLGAVLLSILLLVGGWFGVHHYGAGQFQAGYAAAIAAGQVQRAADVDHARKTETDLRAQLREKDEIAIETEHTYEISLDVAERRMRSGSDRLRCPTASPVQPAPAAGDRPATPAPAADRQGPDIVPEAAADVLGIAANVAGLVRRYGEVVERYDACRAVNAK